MPSRAEVVQAVAASEPELQGLLRDLIAFRPESQAKEATHFPEEARRCIAYVGDFLTPLGFELESWDVGPSATFPAHPLLVARRPGSFSIFEICRASSGNPIPSKPGETRR